MNLLHMIDQDILIKLSIAFVFGCLLGFERSLKRKQASIKTSIVLTVTACLVTIVSIHSAQLYSSPYDMPMDPLRLAAQLISGVSFIGAGIIMARNNDMISGLTTAAIMWSSIGFGIAIGAGFYQYAIFALVLIMIGLEFVPLLMKWLGPKQLRLRKIRIKLFLSEDADLTKLLKEMKAAELKLGHVRIKDLENKTHQMELSALIDDKRYITDVYEKIKAIENVTSIEIDGV